MLDACIACIDDTDGAAIRWVIIGRDVTDLKGRELTGRRQERLAAIGTLAAGLAHEIRNPLHGAILHTRLLERGLGEKQQTELLDSARIIQQEIGRLSKLVDEFLSFARPQAIEPKPVCVKALCKHCVDLLHARAKENGIVISVDLPNNEIMAELDAPRIEQVLLNILHNAIDASAQSETQSGSRQVQLRLSREPRNARIEVSDDGDGLPNDQPIFDAFFSTKTRGTGLGLPIAHRIVSDHHGEIIAKSDSTGATFIVRLPLEHLESHVDRSDRI